MRTVRRRSFRLPRERPFWRSPRRVASASPAVTSPWRRRDRPLTWTRATGFHDAPTLWRDTLAKNPLATIAYVNLGYQTYEAGRPAEALVLYDRGLAIEPDAADLLNDRGLALGALGRADEAIASYERARRSDPTNVESRSNLGNLLAVRGRYDEAEAAYREALRLRPGYAEAHNNLANVLALRGDTAGAIEEYARAIAADPTYVDPHRNLGECYCKRDAPARCDGSNRSACAHDRADRRAHALPGRARSLATRFGTDALAWAPDAAVRSALPERGSPRGSSAVRRSRRSIARRGRRP
jgi:tetratricopeptide (TPR) repeat protein